MVTWLITAGAVIVVAAATTLWWWGLTPWLFPTALALIIAIAEVWWWGPRWQANSLRMQVRDAKARADLENNFRKTIGQLFGGAAVLIGAGFAYYQSQQASQDQLKATYEQINTSREQSITQQQASHDQLISQQVSKGFEQLASDKLAMRLGGIYALEGVMNSSEQYHKPVIEALCAFVREGTKPQPQAIPAKRMKSEASKPTPRDSAPHPLPPPTDIQAALTVIGRRTHTADVADLSRANLSKAALSGANLSRADLGRAYLWGAQLLRANLSWANLSEAKLPRANLSRANLSQADLSGADLGFASLIGANLSGAFLSWAELFDADLSDTDLSGADLRNARLWGADLTDAKVSQAQLNTACGDEKTILPQEMTIKPCP